MTGIARSPSFWPADTSRPVLETTVGAVLRQTAERAASAVALIEGTPDPDRRRRWTFAELLADSERVARVLLGRFAPGDFGLSRGHAGDCDRIADCGSSLPLPSFRLSRLAAELGLRALFWPHSQSP